MAVAKKTVGSGKKTQSAAKAGGKKVATTQITTTKMHTTKIHY